MNLFYFFINIIYIDYTFVLNSYQIYGKIFFISTLKAIYMFSVIESFDRSKQRKLNIIICHNTKYKIIYLFKEFNYESFIDYFNKSFVYVHPTFYYISKSVST